MELEINSEQYNHSYKDELAYLLLNGIENIILQTKDGEQSLAEVLQDYGVEYYTETNPGQYGNPNY